MTNQFIIENTTRAQDAASRVDLGSVGPGVNPEALLVSPDRDERGALERIFEQQGWKLHAVGTLRSAQAFLRDTAVSVVITERDLPQGNWKNVLARIRHLPHAPLLVVTSRLADQYHLSAALNSRGNDVLAKPLCELEVRHVLTHAWRRWGAIERRRSIRPEAGKHSQCATAHFHNSEPL